MSAEKGDATEPVWGAVRTIGSDPVELERFYRAHVRMIEGFVARRTADPQAVADLTADVFLAAIGAAARYDPQRGSPSAWLVGIAYRVVAAEQRRSARGFRAFARFAGQRELESDAIADFEDLLDSNRLGRKVHEELRVLSTRDRALLELTAVDGLSTVEAAQALGLHPATARVRLHRMKQRLRTKLEHRVPELSRTTVPN